MITTEYTIELRMEKSIQRITQPICVRINENETQQIRAKLTYENSPYSIQCDSAELHLLRDDGTWSHLEASVSGSSVTCTIKANQLGKHAQNACAYFFFKQGTQTETTESFQVRVERAAVDTEASDAFFDASMNRIATKWGAYEATAEAQEIARKDAESKRKDAEASRVQAEQSRVQTEQSRVNTEQARVQVEQARADAEQERVQAEQQRKGAESKRTTAEQERTQAESNRANAEQHRTQAEQARAQAESARQSNESTRVTAEQSRQSRFNEMLDAAQNVKFRILSSNEVDSEGKPTITGSSGIIYLVKARQEQETQANHYNEWIYLEGRWELFGSTAPTAAAIEVADIDKLAQGTTIAGNRVLNATGLNALWSKLQTHMHDLENSVFNTVATAKGAEAEARGVRSDITSLWLEQKKLGNDFSTLESETAILKSRTLSVEQKLKNGFENARKSRVVLRIRSISEDTNKKLWCNCSFVNTNGFVDFNGYINTGLIPASIMNRAKGIEGKIFFAFDDVLCELFQPMLDDNISSFPLVWHSTRGKNVYGYLQILFWSICLALPCEENNPNNYRIGKIYTHATYPQYTPHINNSFDGFPQFIEKINKTLSKDGLVASYELY